MPAPTRTIAQVFSDLFSNAHHSGECVVPAIQPNAKGYCYLSLGGRGGKRVRANRFVYEYLNGPIPDGLVVRHTCDRRNCINPQHLVLGTPADNTADMIERGRHRYGIRVTDESLLREAVAMKDAGWTLSEIAAAQGLSSRSSAADRIRRGRQL